MNGRLRPMKKHWPCAWDPPVPHQRIQDEQEHSAEMMRKGQKSCITARSCSDEDCNYTQGIWELSKVYQPELLERVSAGEVREAAGIPPMCVNFRAFSFVMAYNYKIVGVIYGCYITFCVQNQKLFFSKFPIFKNIWIYLNLDFMFRK